MVDAGSPGTESAVASFHPKIAVGRKYFGWKWSVVSDTHPQRCFEEYT
jgi:hypothetical protein